MSPDPSDDLAADANEDRRRAALEPRDDALKVAENAANSPAGREFATITGVATDQPVSECRGLRQ